MRASLRSVHGALDCVDSTADVDRVALLTSEAFRLATTALGSKYRNPKAWAWWDTECQDAKSKAEGGGSAERKAYLDTMMEKRRAYWAEFVSNATIKGNGIWKVMDWRKPRAEAAPPTLTTPDGEAATTKAKALALYKAHFLTEAVDVGGGVAASVSDHPVRVMHTDVPQEQWGKEVWEACAGPSSTAPGEDTSTTADCRAVWPELGPVLRVLYRRCV